MKTAKGDSGVSTSSRARDAGKNPVPRKALQATEILDLETFLPYRLNRLADAVSREFSKIYHDRHGLTRPEWRTLATLGQFGTMTATAIGAHSAMHKTKVSRAVAALEKRRWLERTPDAADRRAEHLTLTAVGVGAYRELAPLAKAFERRMIAGAGSARKSAIEAGLSALEAMFVHGRSSSASTGPSEIFAARKNRADMEAFDRIMSRKGGRAPMPDDTL